MIEIILAFLMMTWDFLRPIIIGGFYLMLFVGIFKWWILDGVTERLDTAIIHLNTIENDVTRMSSAIVNIEEELKWWSDGNTLAKQILKRLDAIEDKMVSAKIGEDGIYSQSKSYSEYKEKYSSGSFSKLVDAEKNISK